ncbi:MAG: DsrE family protein [Haloplanus sp.]
MHLGLVVETNEAERIWNAFRLGNTALDADHAVEVFLLGEGVEAPDVETEKFNPPGLMRKFVRDGGELLACGTCLDSRNLAADDLRPRATMADLLELVEGAHEVLTVG